MFNDQYGLTKAVLEGRKTQTRRIITTPRMFKGNYVSGFHVYKRKSDGFISEICMYDEDERDFDEGQIVPKYKVDEIVAIAQSYNDIHEEVKHETLEMLDLFCSKGWNNKMFVRAELMPHQIRIANIRIERLQDISDQDCLAEGIRKEKRYSFIENVKQTDGDNLAFSCNFNSPREAYSSLIDKISRKGIWANNPYVFVYDFELVK